MAWNRLKMGIIVIKKAANEINKYFEFRFMDMLNLVTQQYRINTAPFENTYGLGSAG